LSTLAKLVVELGLDSSQFTGGIADAEKRTSGLGGVLQTAAGTAASFISAMAGTAAIGGAIDFISDSAIGMNATLETSTLQFQTLMGSADVATQHVKNLFTFAKETPFETQPIIDASAQLQVFGGATLNTMANLTLFGDAAAATTKPLQDISFWSGRMYAALQAGKPIGEAIQNLQQLGVISPQTINQLEAMSKSGASADQMWKVFTDDLGKFSGAMKLQAGTWQGLTSSISDSSKMLAATAFKPLFDAGKRALEGILNLLGRLEASGAAQRFADGLQFVIAVLEKFAGQIIGYGKAAFAWGENIANQFAAGIAAAINTVVSVLKQIGSVIANWLRPGSPPKITPELDEWGKEAGTVYIEGWAQADFSAFDDLSRSIESSLKGLVDTGKFDQRGVIPTLLAGRQGISAGLSEIARLGEVSQATFDGIVSSLGPVGGAVSGLVRGYFDLSAATRRLEAAQDELNRTTQKYADMLAPLNAQMQQLQDQAQHIRNLQRIEELNKTLADSEATQYEKDLAANELQQIALQEQIDGIETQRDAEVATAQAKVDAASKEEAAAKARIDQQQAMLDATNSTNALIAEQASLLESLAKSAAGGGGTGGAGGMPNVGASLQDAVAPMQAVSSAAQDAKAKLDAIEASAQAFVQSIVGVNSTLGTWIETFRIAGEFTTNFPAQLGATIDLLTGASGTFEGFGNAIQGVVDTFIGLLNGTVTFDQFIGSILTGISDLRDQLLQGITNLLPQVLTAFGQLAGPAVDWIVDAIPSLLANVSQFILSLVNQLLTYVPQIAATFVEFGVKAVTWLSERAPEMVNNVGIFFNGLINTLLDNLPRWAENLAQFAQKAATWILDALPGLGANLGKATGVLLSWIATTTADVIPKLLVLAGKFIAWVATDVIPALPGALASILAGIVNFIGNLITTVTPELKRLADKFLTWVATDVIPYIQAKLNAIQTEIIKWIAEKTVWAASEMKKIGAAIVQGIQDGISNAWGRFTGWIQDRINEIPQAVRDVLGIHSPSTVFADLAINSVQGFLVGFQSMWPTVATKLSENARKFVDQFTSNMVGLARGALDSLKAIQNLRAGVDTSRLDNATKRGEDLATQWGAVTGQLQDVQKEIARVNAMQVYTDEEKEAKQKQLNDLYAQQNDLLAEQHKIENQRKVAASDVMVAQDEANRRQEALNKIAEDAAKQYDALRAQVSTLAATDASGALALFNEQSKRIAEMANLRKELALATDQTDIDNLTAQIRLLEQVQALEGTAQAAAIVNVDARGTFGISDFVDMIQSALRAAGVNVDIRAQMG